MNQLNLTDSEKAKLAEILSYVAQETNKETCGTSKGDLDFKPYSFFVGYLHALAGAEIELIQPGDK